MTPNVFTAGNARKHRSLAGLEGLSGLSAWSAWATRQWCLRVVMGARGDLSQFQAPQDGTTEDKNERAPSCGLKVRIHSHLSHRDGKHAWVSWIWKPPAGERERVSGWPWTVAFASL